VIHIKTIVKQLFNTEESQSEFHHCQGFLPTQRTVCAATKPSRHTLLRTVPIISTSIGVNTHRSRNNHHQKIQMSTSNSQESDQMDLYDPDSYSIPEDDLRSASTARSTDEDYNTSESADMELVRWPIVQVQGSKIPQTDIDTESPASEWKELTSSKPSAGRMQHKFMEISDHFDPSQSDRDLPNF
jgi:hypothetical protein